MDAGGKSQRERAADYALEAYGTEQEYLWRDDSRPGGGDSSGVLRHPGSKKWYGIFMDVSRERLGLEEEGAVEILNVKCGPLLTGSLLGQAGFLPAYHMNKVNWISIVLDGTLEDEEIFPLLDLSYGNAAPKRKRQSGSRKKEPDREKEGDTEQ